MAVKLLWYLTSPDGPYPWLESGRWDTDYEHLQQIAITADRLGFYGSLMGTSCLLYTSPSPRDKRQSRMPSSA